MSFEMTTVGPQRTADMQVPIPLTPATAGVLTVSSHLPLTHVASELLAAMDQDPLLNTSVVSADGVPSTNPPSSPESSTAQPASAAAAHSAGVVSMVLRPVASSVNCLTILTRYS